MIAHVILKSTGHVVLIDRAGRQVPEWNLLSFFVFRMLTRPDELGQDPVERYTPPPEVLGELETAGYWFENHDGARVRIRRRDFNAGTWFPAPEEEDSGEGTSEGKGGAASGSTAETEGKEETGREGKGRAKAPRRRKAAPRRKRKPAAKRRTPG